MVPSHLLAGVRTIDTTNKQFTLKKLWTALIWYRLLVVSSTPQGSSNWLVCIYCGYNVMVLYSEHLRQPNLSMLALRVVTGRVLVIVSGVFYVPNWDGTDINMILQFPTLTAKFLHQIYYAYPDQVLNPSWCTNHYTTHASFRCHYLQESYLPFCRILTGPILIYCKKKIASLG